MKKRAAGAVQLTEPTRPSVKCSFIYFVLQVVCAFCQEFLTIKIVCFLLRN